MGRYYYAGGRRVAIAKDARRLAVDRPRARAAGLGPAVEGLPARQLPGEVLLIERSAIEESLLRKLRNAGALRSVYRREAALLVPLPEIRVELDDARQREAVMRSLASAPYAANVTEPVENWLLVTPKSGSGEEAIDIANHLHETARPGAASVRFLQLLPGSIRGR